MSVGQLMSHGIGPSFDLAFRPLITYRFTFSFPFFFFVNPLFGVINDFRVDEV
jgi:hypothetical protein